MADSIRITVLIENTAFGRGVVGEHGLAYWIEAGGKKVLFDTGQTPGCLVQNAEILGVDLASTDAIVLSHGHYDHTGGLEEVLETARKPHLYLHPGALARRYSRKRDGSCSEIGIPRALTESRLQELTSSLVWTEEAIEVVPGVSATGYVPRMNDFEDTGGAFFLDEGCRNPDPIEDDQAVFFDTVEGTVVLLGCAHAGVVNTLRHVQSLTGGGRVHAVIGGMHLVSASPERMDRTVEALKSFAPPRLAPVHCTGARAKARLAKEFPETWEPTHVGSRFEFLR
jgi:7,8-dihydropterin-6-yl-methyl-4-(beta-D-ribofuranosyl)aminobenzene 5'-phosphate synthase